MPTTQEFITKTAQELQYARAMRGDRRSPGAAPHPGEDAGLRVCIDVPGLNRAASQEARYHAVLEEMETVLKEPPGLPEPPEAQGPSGS